MASNNNFANNNANSNNLSNNNAAAAPAGNGSDDSENQDKFLGFHRHNRCYGYGGYGYAPMVAAAPIYPSYGYGLGYASYGAGYALPAYGCGSYMSYW